MLRRLGSLIPVSLLVACTSTDPATPLPTSGSGAARAAVSVQLPSTAGPPDAETQDAEEPGLQPTLAEIFRPPTLIGVRPTELSISADGRQILFRWTAEDTEELERDWWLAATDGSSARVLFEHDSGASPRWTRTGSKLLVSQKGWLSLLDAGDDDPTSLPIFETGEHTGRIVLLESGEVLVQAGADHQLWIVDLSNGHRRTLASKLTNRSAWFEVEEDAGLVALFADDDGKHERVGADAGASTEDESGAGQQQEDGDGTRSEVAAQGGGSANETGNGGDDDDEPEETRRLHLVPLDGEGTIRTVDLEPGGWTDLSADGYWLSVRKSEPSVERELIMADYLEEHVRAVPVRSSLAGDDARLEELELVSATTGDRFTPPIDQAEHYYVRSFRWSPTGSRLLVERVSNDFHVRQIFVLDPRERRAWPVVSEHDEAWIAGPFLWSDWSGDGTEILFTSERSGFNHVYAVSVDGGAARAITEGRHEIKNVRPLEESGKLLVLAGLTNDAAVDRLELVDLADGDRLPLTPDDGCAIWSRRRTSTAPAVSRDGDTVAYPFERLGVPADLYAVRLVEQGRTVAEEDIEEAEDAQRAEEQDADAEPFDPDAPLEDEVDELAVTEPLRLTDTVPTELTGLGLEPPRIVVFRNPEDEALVRAFLYRPVPFDPSQEYPAVVFVHGAGYLQNVKRSMSSYDVNMLFHHRLARKGYVVLDVDFRHSAGYGRDFRTAVHGHLGGKDLDDLVAGVGFLEGLGYVDIDRVGIYGGSYGGFLVLMALFTQPDVFACGAALRSVTDWRVYNHWYTNPRLGTPEDDPEAYERSSPIDHVDGLEHPLLLLHGLQDDNVFAQDTIRLVEALIQKGKDFELMIYPSQGHAFSDPESWIDEYARIERLMDEHLQVDDTPPGNAP